MRIWWPTDRGETVPLRVATALMALGLFTSTRCLMAQPDSREGCE